MSTPPSGFSWISDNVAAFAMPYSTEEIEYLVSSARLSHVITLCEDKPDFSKYPSIEHHYIPIDSFDSPSLNTIKKVMSIIHKAEANDEKVGIHCVFGRGRTGTVLACYLAHRNDWQADRAIQQVRRLRPKSIEPEQEVAVVQYVKSLHQQSRTSKSSVAKPSAD